MSPWVVIAGVVALVAMLLAPALLMAYVHGLLVDARHAGWVEGFDEARRIDRRTERRWDGLETRDRRPRGPGPREVIELSNFS